MNKIRISSVIILCITGVLSLFACKSYSSWECRQLPDSTIHLINIAKLEAKEIRELISILSEKPIKVLGLNMHLNEEMVSDSILVNTFTKFENVVLATSNRPNIELQSQHNDRVAFGSNKLIKKKGVVNSYFTSIDTDAERSSSFSFEILKKIYPTAVNTLPIIKAEQIDYTGDIGCFNNNDASLIIDRDDAIYWKDKIVILGYLGSSDDGLFRTETDSTDSYVTPLSKTNKVYSTVIHANILIAMKRRYLD